MAAPRAQSPRLRGRAGGWQAEALCDSCSRQKLKTRAAESYSSNHAAAGTHRRSIERIRKRIRRNPASRKQKEQRFPLNSLEARRCARASMLKFLTLRLSPIK